jgi:hypothetical protein
MRLVRFMLLALGVLGIVISLPILGFAALGFLGILADIGPNENRALGIQAVYLALPFLIGGAMFCALALLAFAGNRRRTPGPESRGQPLFEPRSVSDPTKGQ